MSDLSRAEAREAVATDWLRRMEQTVTDAKRDVKIARLAVLEAQGAGDCIEAWWVKAWLACDMPEDALEDAPWLACDEPEAAFGSDE